MRGEAHRLSGDTDGAIADYLHALRIDDRNLAWVYGNLGVAYEAKRDWVRAEASFDHIIVKNGRDAGGPHQRCFVRAVIGKNLDGALADCEEAVKRSVYDKASVAPTLSMRGFVHFQRKEYRLALADFDSAIAHGGSFASAFYLRGLTKRALGDPSASDDLTRAHGLDPAIATTYASYGVPEPDR
jgi:tetratricopeptide (TPR) repeat protein